MHLGEAKSAGGRLLREPPGCIRYQCIRQAVTAPGARVRLTIPADQRNTGPGAVLMPASIGEVFPFRYVEIEQAACYLKWTQSNK